MCMYNIRNIKNNKYWHSTFYRSEGSELIGFIATHTATRYIYVTKQFHTKSFVGYYNNTKLLCMATMLLSSNFINQSWWLQKWQQ